MIPEELKGHELPLSRAKRYPIVVITGNELRHHRFALRIQEEFGEAVVAWIQVQPPNVDNQCNNLFAAQFLSKLWSVVLNPNKLSRVVPVLRRHIPGLSPSRRSRPSQREVERLLLEKELERLRRTAHLKPRSVDNPNSQEIVEWVRSLQPYFLLTLGGAIYDKPLLECVKGLTLNQHDGWCPEYKGAHSVYWTLYKRDVSHLGNTVHILTGGTGSGPILRRSTACLVPGDTPESCLVRSVALGTELMCEAVHEIIRTNKVTVFDQPPELGRTYLMRQLDENIKRSIERDFEAGWLQNELFRLRQF